MNDVTLEYDDDDEGDLEEGYMNQNVNIPANYLHLRVQGTKREVPMKNEDNPLHTPVYIDIFEQYFEEESAEEGANRYWSEILANVRKLAYATQHDMIMDSSAKMLKSFNMNKVAWVSVSPSLALSTQTMDTDDVGLISANLYGRNKGTYVKIDIIVYFNGIHPFHWLIVDFDRNRDAAQDFAMEASKILGG